MRDEELSFVQETREIGAPSRNTGFLLFISSSSMLYVCGHVHVINNNYYRTSLHNSSEALNLTRHTVGQDNAISLSPASGNHVSPAFYDVSQTSYINV
jgi:hypothetical protein